MNDLYQLKSIGNSAAHALNKYSKAQALEGLKKLYEILVWFTNSYFDGQENGEDF